MATSIISRRSYAGLFSTDKTHSFEFREQELAFEDSFSFNIDSPVALRTASFWGVRTNARGEMRIGRGLYPDLAIDLPNE